MNRTTRIFCRWSARLSAAFFAAALVVAPAAWAQQEGGQPAEQEGGGKPNMFGGFGASSDQPYEILADQLQVFDAEKYAILTGDVSVRQETSLLKTPYLKVFYAGEAQGSGGGDSQGIRRLEARQGVYVESGTQIATGDEADYDAATEIIEMTGNVVLTDAGNVVKGEKLIINLRTGESRVFSPGNRIRMILQPNKGGAGAPPGSGGADEEAAPGQ